MESTESSFSSCGAEQAFAPLYDRLSPGAREVARLIACLAPSPIPVELARRLGLSAGVCGELVETSFVSGVGSEPGDPDAEVPPLEAMDPALASYLRGRAVDATAEVARAVEEVTSMLSDALKAGSRGKVLVGCAPHSRHLLRMTHPAEGAVPIPMELRAALAAVHSDALDELGWREEALATIAEAAGAYRQLAAAKPGAFEPALAMSLNNLSYQLSRLRRWEEAVVPLEEAVRIRRQLAASRPDAFEPGLAFSLDSLSSCLSMLGRRQEALSAIGEAVEILRRLAKAKPSAFEPDLAASLRNLSSDLRVLGRREEAVTATEEAVEVYRRLAKKLPGAFTLDLVAALLKLAGDLSGLQRDGEASRAAAEAGELTRWLGQAPSA